MDLDQRIGILEKMNEVFYEIYADTFSHTRQYAWQGWKALLHALEEQGISKGECQEFKVLDVGCGNGRFLFFLIEQIKQGQWQQLSHYLGLDRSLGLLQHAQIKLKEQFESRSNQSLSSSDQAKKSGLAPTVALTAESSLPKELPSMPAFAFKAWDWDKDLGNLLHGEKYDLLCLFGVLHHMANYQRRIQYLWQLATLLKPNAFLCVSVWDFAAHPRGLNAVLDWESTAMRFGLNPMLKEEGDYFLGWQGNDQFPRYCHYLSTEEEKTLIYDLSSVLSFVTSLTPSSEMNRYLLFKKNSVKA